MFNKKKIFILIALVGVVIITISLFYFGNIQYFLFTSRIAAIDSNGIQNIIESKDGCELLILVGRSSCSTCIDIHKDIKLLLKKIPDSKSIYYYDTDKNRECSNFMLVGEYLKLEYVPSLICIKNGFIEFNFSPIELIDIPMIEKQIL